LIAIDAGLHLTAELREGLDEGAVVERARVAGLRISGLSNFSVESKRRGLTFGYGNTPREKLEQALRILSKVARR